MLQFYNFRNEQTKVHQKRNILKKYEQFKTLVYYERQLFKPNPNYMEELNKIIIIENMELNEDEEQVK